MTGPGRVGSGMNRKSGLSLKMGMTKFRNTVLDILHIENIQRFRLGGNAW